MTLLSSLLLGAALGALATVSHAALFPLGLVISLSGTFAGLRLIINHAGSRLAGLVAALGWVIVALRAAVPGGSGEMLIWGQTEGMLFLLGGAISVIIPLLIEPKLSKRVMDDDDSSR